MPLLSDADAISVGGTPATRVYAGTELVWGQTPVAYAWVGAQTSSGFTVAAETSDPQQVTVQASTSQDMSNPVSGVAASVDVDGFVKCSVTGLTAGTQYYWRLLQGGAPVSVVGKSRTLPVGQADFTVAFGHCMSSNVDDSYARVLAREPLFLLHLGDWHYLDITTSDPVDHRDAIVDKIYGGVAVANDTLKNMLSVVPTYYLRSDHDGGGGNNADAGAYYVANQTAYKQVVPHQPLVDQPTDALYTAWTVGRVRFIQLDTRNMYRSPGLNTDDAAKTMLGATQKAWLKTELARPEVLKVVQSDPPWVGETVGAPQSDKWPAYATERAELAAYIDSVGANVLMLVGDYHSVMVSSGSNNPDGGFPVIGAGPFWQSGGSSGSATYDFLLDAGGSKVGRYGTLDFVDSGASIEVTFTAFDSSDDSVLHTVPFTFNEPAASGAPAIESFSAVEYFAQAVDYWTLDIPAGTQPGDYLVAFLHSQATGMTSDASSVGWTRLGEAFASPPADERYGAAFGRVADGTEGATVTFADPGGPGPRKLGCVVRLTGVDTTNAVVAYTDNQTLDTAMDTAAFSGGPHLELTHIGATCAAGNYGTVATAGVGTTVVATGAGPVDDGTASADWQHVYQRGVTGGGGGLTWAVDGPAPAADHMNCYVIRAAMVWDVEETFDARPTGALTASNGIDTNHDCTVTDVGPLSGSKSMVTKADGTYSAIRYVTGGSYTCEFTAKKNAGTQTNHALVWIGKLSGVARADLQFRNDGSGKLWLRYNYIAPASGKSVGTFAVGDVFRVRVRFVAGVSLEADLWYGANLNGAVPDETLNVNTVADLATDAPLADAWLGNAQASGLQFMIDDVRLVGLA